MKPYSTLAALLFFFSAASFTGASYAQKKSESDEIKAVIENFHAAITARDVKKMEELWVRDHHAILLNPRDKDPWVGWDAIKPHWQETFDFWSEVKVTVRAVPQVHVKRDTAWSVSVAEVEGKSKAGQAQRFKVLETAVFEKRGNRWLVASHHASRQPE
jgi:ketosteroid isomerase-like protein